MAPALPDLGDTFMLVENSPIWQTHYDLIAQTRPCPQFKHIIGPYAFHHRAASYN